MTIAIAIAVVADMSLTQAGRNAVPTNQLQIGRLNERRLQGALGDVPPAE